MLRDATNSTFVLCFTRVEAISGYHDGCRVMPSIQRLYCVLHASRRYQGTIMDAKRCYEFSFCIEFYTHRADIRVPFWMPRDATNSTFVLCFTRIEAISGYHYRCRGMLRIQICILFYTHRGDIRVPLQMPRDAMNSAFVLCFTLIEAISGYHD
jgi:hypothetical protein